MALKFNPLTGNFDFTGSGGGGGSAFFAGEVATYADLPLDGTAALNSRWLVRSNSGTWPFSTYKQAGVYVRKATVGASRDNDYQLTDTSFFDVMSDNKFLVFDNSDATKALAFDVGTNVPASSTVTLTVPASSGTIALTSQLGGGTKTYAVFTASDGNQPPASAFATLDTRNSIAVLDFDDAATESAVFVGVMPEAASLGSGLIVSLRWMATTATSGDVRWSVAWEKSNTDLDSDSFDTATAATATTNGTSGIVTVTNITCTTIDSLAAGDLFRLRVQRIGGDGADTMTGDAELVAVEIRSAA
jgi:hypothetical protein